MNDRLGIRNCQENQLDTVKDLNRSLTTNEKIPEDLSSVLLNNQGYISERVLLTCLALKDMLAQIPGCRSLIAAFALHTILIGELQLSSRRLPCVRSRGQNSELSFLNNFLDALARKFSTLLQVHEVGNARCDVADLWDSRLLFVCCANFKDIVRKLSATAKVQFEAIFDFVITQQQNTLVEHKKSSYSDTWISFDMSTRHPPPENDIRILPFVSPIFDKHLSLIKLDIDNTIPDPQPLVKVYKDLTHWHNAKKPLNPKRIPPEMDWAKRRALRRDQFYMTEMLFYAASLTNASGKTLEPETIVVTPRRITLTPSKTKADRSFDASVPTPSKRNFALIKEETAKNAVKQGKLTNKEVLLQKIAMANVSKDQGNDKKTIDSWRMKKAQMDADNDLERRYAMANQYLRDIPKPKQLLLENEIKLYQIQTLLALWSKRFRGIELHDGYSFVTIAVNLLYEISTSSRITNSEARVCSAIAKHLTIPLSFVSNSDMRAMSFDFVMPLNVSPIPLPWIEFLLLHYGPYMVRNIDSQTDSRVSFEPDAWQARVLDEIDANNSVFVVAPTSSGKTFISFYAMEQVLREDNDGVLVYLAPTKALVNQIAAEVQARFSKKYRHASRCTWAVHPRDHRINNPIGCQILVTVPHILQILLLAPENARKWSTNVRRIIFDEIHCIGQQEDGLIWEQLLLLAPCPIIALSATVGNPREFANWMRSTQNPLGHELVMIEHQHRYSDLRKFRYNPPKKFIFRGLARNSSLTSLSLDQDPSFVDRKAPNIEHEAMRRDPGPNNITTRSDDDDHHHHHRLLPPLRITIDLPSTSEEED